MTRGTTLCLGALALVAFVAGCPKDDKGAPPAPVAEAGASDASTPTSSFNGFAVTEKACFSCHTIEMLRQQRLTQPQWTKVVTKMVSWGAVVEAGDVAPLAKFLAEQFGPDAGPDTRPVVAANEALVALEPTDDGTWPKGDAAAGKPLFVDTCSGCHGADARGNIGVNLVERPILYRIDDFAQIIHDGKGLMKPLKLERQPIADILAHLRSLRVPPPPPPAPPASAAPASSR